MPDDPALINVTNLLAGQAVADVTAYLDGRHEAAQLGVDVIKLEARVLGSHPPAVNGLVQGVRLLIIAAKGIVAAERDAAADGAALIRREKWQMVASQLVELIKFESRVLIERGADQRGAWLDDEVTRLDQAGALQAELAVLEAKNAAAPGWGAAVGARHERITEIRRRLAQLESAR